MATTPTAAPPARRIGLREIAQSAGVSLMTVSLALHNSPKISVPTRRRVRAAAKRLGYQPDPELSRLMNRLRLSRVTQRSTVIALFDLRARPDAPLHTYNERLRRGIAGRAQQLGFGLDEFRFEQYGRDVRSLLRVVRQRGIRGALLLPAEKPFRFPRGVRWDGISVVSATTSVLFPRFHRVAPNQLHNLITLLDTLTARGFRRIGLIVSAAFEERSAHYHSLIFSARGHAERILILPAGDALDGQAGRIRQWCAAQAPDVIVAQNPEPIARLLRATRGPNPPLVSLSTRNDHAFPYQDELPDSIGAAAVDLLAGMMANHETGIPSHPWVTLIDGRFRAGRSPRARSAKPPRPRRGR